MTANNKKIDLTIVTVNWNVTDKLQKCIDSVIGTCGDIEYEMFIIDNNSQDADFSEVIKKYRKYPSLVFIKNDKNEGAIVLNKIQNKIRGRYLLFLGPDVILKKNTVKELLNFMEINQYAGGASAKLLNPDGSPQMYYYKFWTLSMFFYLSTIIGGIVDRYIFANKKCNYYTGQNLDINSVIEIDQPPAACLIVRTEILFKDGYIIDPKFPFYFNDVDICKRIWNRGYKIYLVVYAEVIHEQSSSFKKSDPEWCEREYKKSAINFFYKYYPDKVWILKLLIRFDTICRFLYKKFQKLKYRNNFLQDN